MEDHERALEADPVAAAENRLDAAEEEDDPTRLEALSLLHDILETELDRPEETSVESHSEEAEPTTD